MKVCLLTREKNPALLKRLQLLGHGVRAESPERVQTLEPNSTDLVYLIPCTVSEEESWSEQRVILARASRYYLVYGKDLDTLAIMNAARDGAYDVLDEKDSDARWNEAIEGAAKSQALWWQLYGGLSQSQHEKLMGNSSAMRALRESIQRIGPTDASVLVMGESGTGKELVAECLHDASGKGKFVAVNCAAIPPDLMESELFGVQKGAFTGAGADKPGLVEEASGGTIFLDEIGEMDISLQPKLLRFLETRQARRVGSTKEYHCNVRVISATNRDLRADSEAGRFRLDLYYRISEVILNTPPLRHHSGDIPELARSLLDAAAIRLGKNFETIEPELIYRFQLYDWPGNVRELKQVIDRLAIHYTGPVMRAAWWEPPEKSDPYTTVLPGGFKRRTSPPPSPATGSSPPPFVPQNSQSSARRGTGAPFAGGGSGSPFAGGGGDASQYRRSPLPNKRERFQLARELLEQSDGDLAWTAAQLGIHPTTLYRWRKSGKV